MYGIVKFKDQRDVQVFGLGNSSYGSQLLTMDNVEWVQVLTPSGYLCAPNLSRDDVSHENIAPMVPPFKAADVRLPKATLFTNVKEAIDNGQKITAIKHYRQNCRDLGLECMLIDAKRAVDAVYADTIGDNYCDDPDIDRYTIGEPPF
jgi:hypothetical protein